MLIINEAVSSIRLNLIHKSTSDRTKSKYNCIIKKWLAYCSNFNILEYATTNTFANFMASEFDNKLSYSYIKGFSALLVKYTSIPKMLIGTLS